MKDCCDVHGPTGYYSCCQVGSELTEPKGNVISYSTGMAKKENFLNSSKDKKLPCIDFALGIVTSL